MLDVKQIIAESLESKQPKGPAYDALKEALDAKNLKHGNKFWVGQHFGYMTADFDAALAVASKSPHVGVAIVTYDNSGKIINAAFMDHIQLAGKDKDDVQLYNADVEYFYYSFVNCPKKEQIRKEAIVSESQIFIDVHFVHEGAHYLITPIKK